MSMKRSGIRMTALYSQNFEKLPIVCSEALGLYINLNETLLYLYERLTIIAGLLLF